jgi:hypothetical protein
MIRIGPVRERRATEMSPICNIWIELNALWAGSHSGENLLTVGTQPCTRCVTGGAHTSPRRSMWPHIQVKRNPHTCL